MKWTQVPATETERWRNLSAEAWHTAARGFLIKAATPLCAGPVVDLHLVVEAFCPTGDPKKAENPWNCALLATES
jgi:hypothetical protein